MAAQKPNKQSVSSESSFSTIRQDKYSYTVTDYRKAALEDLSRIENVLRDENLSKEFARIDAEYNYKKSKLDKQEQINLKVYEAYAKARSRLAAKYKISEDLSKEDFEKQLKELSARDKKKYDKQLESYKRFLEARQELEEKIEQKGILRELALARNQGAGTIRSGKLLDWTMWRQFSRDTAGIGAGGKIGAALDGLVSGLSDFAKKLDNTIDTIGAYQSRWDTRLYGYSGSSYSSITRAVTGSAGMSPLVQQSKIMQNIDSLIQQGIAYNVEQRGFLQTIAEKIATTFDAANGTLLQLIRVQQADTTAARLGLEAGVTKYLNNMFANSEYMSSLYKSVLGNLYEATSQMGAGQSVGFEYQVQKWLGSLYSVGMSQGAISNISAALGQLGSGNIGALTGNSAMQNLLVMAASRGGLSYADLLTGGLSANSTNLLMQGLVSYLAEIGASNNNVVKSQYANIFGMSLSDLRAAANLSSSLKDIAGSGMDYNSAMGNLFGMANSMYGRMSVGEIMSNAWQNMQYSMASGIAMNPAMYALYKASGLLESTTGGIALPDIKYLGTGVNLQTTVADLMRVGALSGGIISSIAAMMGSGGNGGFTGSALLRGFGINPGELTTISRGNAVGLNENGFEISRTNYIGNANAEEIKGSIVAEAEADANKKLVQMQEEAQDETKLSDINTSIQDIISILRYETLRVTVDIDNNPSAMN